MVALTVDSCLKLLATNLAGKLPDTCLFIELDRDGLLVVTEEAREVCWKYLLLEDLSLSTTKAVDVANIPASFAVRAKISYVCPGTFVLMP